MTTKDILKQMEKEFDENKLEKLLVNRVYGLICKDCAGGGADGQNTCQKCGGCGIHNWNSTELKDDLIKLYKSSIRTLLESFGEEIIGRDRDEVIGNETYINTIIENQLRAEQRLKMKEILEVIK